jgi:hypothetical protein
MRIFLMGAAALALAASGASADPGKGNGGGNGHGGAKAAAGPSMAGGQAKGHGNQGHGKQPKAARAQPVHVAQGPAAHGPAAHGPGAKAKADRPAQRANGNGHGNGNVNVRGNGHAKGNAKAAPVRVVKEKARDVREVREVRDVRIGRRGDDGPHIVRTVVRFDPRGDRGLIKGCPPGLAKKHNGCMPPGLARDRANYRDAYYRPSWFGYNRIGDGRYRYDNGYLYRVNDLGSVLGYIPLLGGALSVGNPWPSYYDPVPVPDYYVDYYNLGSPGAYRYADDVLYRVDPRNDAITSIAALLTGDQFAVGQRMPAGYDVYNVPYAYRDRYYDTPQYDYRYADGYIYQVDPTTQLIAAAIQLLT